MSSPTDEPSLESVLTALEDWINYQKETGLTEVVLSRKPALTTSQPEPPPQSQPQQPKGEDMIKQDFSSLDTIAQAISTCRKCGLCEGRTNTVPGEGTPKPRIMFVGEGPGADEDAQGRPFVGRAGKLLTKMIEAMGLQREDVFIANIVKCRPPGNRVPTPEEMATCMPYLKAQIALLKPEVIIALGATSVKGLLGQDDIKITKMRGTWQKLDDIDLMPTLHPAYLLRNPPAKKDAWEDLKTVLKHLRMPVPKTKNS
jgi:DNA polymerase